MNSKMRFSIADKVEKGHLTLLAKTLGILSTPRFISGLIIDFL